VQSRTKPAIKERMMAAKLKPKPTLSARPFETDYAGAWRGHCKTRESAIRAAIRHILDDYYTACTVTGPGGEHVARIRVADRARKRVEITLESPLRQMPALKRVK
jgi:hypothetical protein